jgi:hypothetical protein
MTDSPSARPDPSLARNIEYHGAWPVVDLSGGEPLAPVYIVPGLVVHPGDTLIIGLPETISAERADDYVRTAREQEALADVDVVFVAGVTEIAKIERARPDQAQEQPGAQTLSQDGSIVPGMRATHGAEAAASDAFQRAGWAAFVICGLALFAWLVTWLVRVIWS